ncbi:hypothetical protein OHB24_35335 [Kribbella sp. NBC_00482]|uniref:hypothetical protein n=1 Tax=Kribbella sp. NBC_00482 TaxID=2975968 RepID=UPI002E178E2C
MRAKDALYRAFTKLHGAVFFRSKGRVFGRAAGMTVVGLLTIGRKTGQRRTTILTAPIADEGTGATSNAPTVRSPSSSSNRRQQTVSPIRLPTPYVAETTTLCRRPERCPQETRHQ